jgi:membrane protein DedA with SNARE-associated domain
MNLLIEAILVGLVVLAIGTIVSYFIGKSMGVDLPKVCKDWNKNYIMEISLFLTGVFSHLFFELLGLNSWYCKHGRACQK